MTNPDIQGFEAVGVKVSFSDDELALFSRFINNEIDEQSQAEILAANPGDPEIKSEVPALVENWAFPDDPSEYLEFANGVTMLRRLHDGQVLNVAEWGLSFTADIKISASKSVRAFRSLGALMVDGVNLADRKAFVSAPWSRRGRGSEERLDDFLGFVVSPNLAEQDTTGYIVPEVEGGDAALRALSSLLVENR